MIHAEHHNTMDHFKLIFRIETNVFVCKSSKNIKLVPKMNIILSLSSSSRVWIEVLLRIRNYLLEIAIYNITEILSGIHTNLDLGVYETIFFSNEFDLGK